MEHSVVARSDTHMPYLVQVREGIRIVEKGHIYVVELWHNGRWTPGFACETNEEARGIINKISRKPTLELIT